MGPVTVSAADWDAGLDVLARMASTGRTFSANDCRSDLRDAGFSRFSTGALFLYAEQQKIIRQVGLERSTDKPTHGSRLARWISADAPALHSLIPTGEAIPVNRDRSGRFAQVAQTTPADGPSLLDLLTQET